MPKIMSFKAAALFIIITNTGVAHATKYGYDTRLGGSDVRLTIDTFAGTAKIVGDSTNVVFSGANLRSFDGLDSSKTIRFTEVNGVINNGSALLTPIIDNRTNLASISFFDNGLSAITSAAITDTGQRTSLAINSSALIPLQPITPPSTSTSTGGLDISSGIPFSGSSTGANAPTSGGTNIPSPGVLGLLGLGLAGLAFGRRRRKT